MRHEAGQGTKSGTQTMARVEKSIEIQAPIAVVQGVIWDFARYPDFVPHLEDVEVLWTEGETRRVHFNVNLFRRIGYTLDLRRDEGKGLVWTLAEGPFQRNEGGWALEALGPDRTRATYHIDARLSAFIPRFIEDRLIAQSLPETLEAFRDEAQRRALSAATPKG